MKPDKRQLATLHDMETWAYKVKKDAKEWKRNVENVFHEELRDFSSFPSDIEFLLDMDLDIAMSELLEYIKKAKNDLKI